MLSPETILAAPTLSAADLPPNPDLLPKEQGKVRDIYRTRDGSRRILITTDRQSAFDALLGLVPFKGHVLTRLAEFWFDHTADIIPNHLLGVPDPNVTVAQEIAMIPIEIVVRGYMTGVTSTSIWTLYQQGERHMYGLDFPDGMRKNQPLPAPIITPTSHAVMGAHDAPLSRADILGSGIIGEDEYSRIETAALAIFARGQEICRNAGLILVDTKYEFGRAPDGTLVVADEVHTPDSSRFWLADSYAARHAAGNEPENFDKEVLRLWLKERGFGGDGTPPALDADIVVRLSQRYQAVYERITGRLFDDEVDFATPPLERIVANLRRAEVLA